MLYKIVTKERLKISRKILQIVVPHHASVCPLNSFASYAESIRAQQLLHILFCLIFSNNYLNRKPASNVILKSCIK